MSQDAKIARKVVQRFAADLTVKFKNTIERVVSRHGGNVKRDEVFAVLQHFGYATDPTVTLLDHGKLVSDLRSPAEGQARYKALKKHEVSALPASPKVGDFYVMDLKEPAETIYAAASVSYHAWEGVESWTIRSPEGKTFELVPDKHARSKKRDRIDPKPLVEWVRTSTDLPAKYEAIKSEKREVVLRSRENTGTCGACLRNIKLKERGGKQHPVIVLHGYMRPGSGTTIGRCFGVDFPPYELSDEASKFVLGLLKKRLPDQEKYLAKLERNDPTELPEIPGLTVMSKPIVRANVHPLVWADELKRVTREAASNVRKTKEMIDLFEKLVRDWELTPLPGVGEESALQKKLAPLAVQVDI